MAKIAKTMIQFSFLILTTTGMHAADYYSPVPQDLEPFGRFQLESFQIDADQETLRYELPRELTGRRQKIEMQLIRIEDDGSLFYKSSDSSEQAPGASARCMGELSKPSCVIKHRNIPIDPVQLENAINDRYFDPELRRQALQAANSFASSNEPLGFLGSREPKLNTVYPRRYRSFYLAGSGANQRMISATLVLMETRGVFCWDSIPASKCQLDYPQAGLLQNVRWDRNHLRAYWQAGEDGGWVDFSFKADFTEFQGYWGHGRAGSKRQGSWQGRSIE